MRQQIVIGAVVISMAASGLAACSGDGDGERARPSATVIKPGRPGEPNKTEVAGPTSPAPPTAAEIGFFQMMIPHHQQAVDMSKLAPGRAADAKIKSLAGRVDVGQAAEIGAMQSWLKRHRRYIALKYGRHGVHGGGHGPTGMPGMATSKQLAQLKAARGGAFDDLYLRLMIPHHQGALTMARSVLGKGGSDVTVTQTARDVLSTQQAEINRMRAILAG